MGQPTTYSFKDLLGVFTHPLAGGFPLVGNIGMGQVGIDMTTEKTAQDVSADGTVQVTYIAGDNGVVTIECQQTSNLHKFLLTWFNIINLAASQNDDVSNWANASLTLQNRVDGTGHQCTGGSPAKIPTKTYAAQGGKVTWSIPFANIQNSTY